MLLMADELGIAWCAVLKIYQGAMPRLMLPILHVSHFRRGEGYHRRDIVVVNAAYALYAVL